MVFVKPKFWRNTSSNKRNGGDIYSLNVKKRAFHQHSWCSKTKEITLYKMHYSQPVFLHIVDYSWSLWIGLSWLIHCPALLNSAHSLVACSHLITSKQPLLPPIWPEPPLWLLKPPHSSRISDSPLAETQVALLHPRLCCEPEPGAGHRLKALRFYGLQERYQ